MKTLAKLICFLFIINPLYAKEKSDDSTKIRFETLSNEERYTVELLRASARITYRFKNGGGRRGSAVAFAHYEDGTLLLSNDHVCQWARGVNPDNAKEPNCTSKLNTIYADVDIMDKFNIVGGVIFTSNFKNPRFKNVQNVDLCILYIPYEMSIIKLSKRNPLIGEKILSVSSPSGIFPKITNGYVGAWSKKGSFTASTQIGSGSSGSGAISLRNGKLIGIAKAMISYEKTEVPLVAFYVPISKVHKFLLKFEAALKE